MNVSDSIIEVRVKQAGQPRPYADSIYEADIVITSRRIKSQEAIEFIAREFLREWDKRIEEDHHLGHTLLKRCELISNEQLDAAIKRQTWRVIVISYYCD